MGSSCQTFWWGVAVGGHAAAETGALHQTMVAAITDPEVAGKFTGQGVIINTSLPAEFTEYLDSEITRWTAVMKAADVTGPDRCHACHAGAA